MASVSRGDCSSARSKPGRPALTNWTRDSLSLVITCVNEASPCISSARPGALVRRKRRPSSARSGEIDHHHLGVARHQARQGQRGQRDALARGGAEDRDLVGRLPRSARSSRQLLRSSRSRRALRQRLHADLALKGLGLRVPAAVVESASAYGMVARQHRPLPSNTGADGDHRPPRTRAARSCAAISPVTIGPLVSSSVASVAISTIGSFFG